MYFGCNFWDFRFYLLIATCFGPSSGSFIKHVSRYWNIPISIHISLRHNTCKYYRNCKKGFLNSVSEHPVAFTINNYIYKLCSVIVFLYNSYNCICFLYENYFQFCIWAFCCIYNKQLYIYYIIAHLIWSLRFITIYVVWKFLLRSTWRWPNKAETCCANEQKTLILIIKLLHVTVLHIYI
jgi:hypothetical protein